MSALLEQPTITQQYIYHQDPGHGWVAVPVAELVELGIRKQITSYSYVSSDAKTAYLEEDCDAATWDMAYRMKHGHAPNVIRIHTNGESFIRSLNCLNP